MAEDTRREVLSAAFDTMSAETTSTPEPVPAVETSTAPPPAPEPGASTSPAPARPRDDGGRFTKVEKTEEKPPETAKADAPAAPVEGQGKGTGAEPSKPLATAASPAAPVPEPAPKAPEFKAPQAWKPQAREAWTKLPADVQAEVTRREREITTRLNEVAEKEKTFGPVAKALTTFEPTIRARGLEPAQIVTRMLQTEHALQYGTPQQKAQLLATAIKDYGVDIATLDQVLSGQAPTTSAAVDPQTIAQQVRQQIEADIRRQAQEAQGKRTQERLAKFAEGHEFYEDVRNAMADILAARGLPNPSESELEQVYDLACRVHPDISGVVEQRKAAKAAATAQAAQQRTAAAASSVKSNPAGAAPAAQPKGRREVLEAAYDKASGGGRL